MKDSNKNKVNLDTLNKDGTGNKQQSGSPENDSLPQNHTQPFFTSMSLSQYT